MWEWLVNYGGFLGLPSMKDISTIPKRYRQWRQEGQDAEIQRESDLNELFRGMAPPSGPTGYLDDIQAWHPRMRSPSSPNYRSHGQPHIEDDFRGYMGPPDSMQLPLETKEEFEKRLLLEQLQRRGGGISI